MDFLVFITNNPYFEGLKPDFFMVLGCPRVVGGFNPSEKNMLVKLNHFPR